jgi:transcriptional regulator with XRE-family HTH domain
MELSTMVELNTKAIGIVVRSLRKEKGISQEVLSGFAGIARSHLAMIETGDKIPNLITTWRIALAFDLHPYELVKMIEDVSKDL